MPAIPRSNRYGLVAWSTLILALAITSCRSAAPPTAEPIQKGVFAAGPDLMPNLTLIDQNGKPVNLADLRGHPTLVDFIYTSCPGPCEMMTARMARIADSLGARLGAQVTMVTFTIDPEHDGPAQLLDYSKRFDADRKGWVFLTGTTAQIEQVMKTYGLQRLREPDGSLDHELVIFLLGANGALSAEYAPTHTQPTTIVADVDRLLTDAPPQL